MAWTINRALLWDVDASDLSDERFRRFYVQRVLERGGAADVRALGVDTIRRYLSSLRLPPDLARFWRWYLEEQGRSRLGPADGSATLAR